MINKKLLQQIALGYVINYRSFNISTRNTYTDITTREIEFFTKQGEYLGFRSIREENKIDLIWKDIITNEIVMYLERETKDTRIESNTLKKLMEYHSGDGKNKIKIGLFGWVTEDTYEKIKKELGKIGNSLFIIWFGEKIDTVNKIIIIVNYENEINCLELKTEIDSNKYWIINFQDKIEWKKKEGIV